MAKSVVANSRLYWCSSYKRTSINSSLLSTVSFGLRYSQNSTYCNFPSPKKRLVSSGSPSITLHRRIFSAGALDSSEKTKQSDETIEEKNDVVNNNQEENQFSDDNFPTGEFRYNKPGVIGSLAMKLKMLFALPWERVKKQSVLHMKLRGQISDQLKSRFSPGLSLPQICENFIKAAYDPRIAGVYLHIDSLNCGWAKVEEIKRHIVGFKKSGKFVIAYIPTSREKEYYLASACDEIYAPPSAYFSLYGLTVEASFLKGIFEKIGVEPEVQRIGKYKSAGDQLTRKSLSEENRETLTVLLENVYGNWLDVISSAKGKTREYVQNFIDEGVFKVSRLKEEGFITDIVYDDEITSRLKERLGVEKEKPLRMVDYKKYSQVRKWTLNLSGGKDLIAVIRASGSITRVKSSSSLPGSGVVGESFIEKIRFVRESKRFKAVIIRIDSPGGDALASDLMWREIKLLSQKKPVVASMSDVAASGGYYMAMAADAIVAENLTLTGSIGVVTGRFNLQKLYEKIGFNKETISKGKYAEIIAAENRPMRPDEADLFARSAQNAYEMFRDKAAISRSLPIEKMEEVAQGRVWSGKDAASRGLVDAIGGFSRAVAIAAQKANIPADRKVTIVELSKPSPSLPEILSGLGSSATLLDATINGLRQQFALRQGLQARIDPIFIQSDTDFDPIQSFFRDYLGFDL